jgi:hypothetical protein
LHRICSGVDAQFKFVANQSAGQWFFLSWMIAVLTNHGVHSSVTFITRATLFDSKLTVADLAAGCCPFVAAHRYLAAQQIWCLAKGRFQTGQLPPGLFINSGANRGLKFKCWNP